MEITNTESNKYINVQNISAANNTALNDLLKSSRRFNADALSLDPLMLYAR
jgi:hypothetical protein